MKFNYEKLKLIFLRSFSRIMGWERNLIEPLAVNPIECMDLPDVGEIVGIEGISFLRYFSGDVYICLMGKDGWLRLLLIFGNNCSDVSAAQEHIKMYKKSKYHNVFRIVNDISDSVDSLVLEADFDAVSEEDAEEMLCFLFLLLRKNDFVEAVSPVLKFFEENSKSFSTKNVNSLQIPPNI